jgi:hypothetical protein
MDDIGRVGPNAEKEPFFNRIEIDANAVNGQVANVDEQAADAKRDKLYIWGGAKYAFLWTKP